MQRPIPLGIVERRFSRQTKKAVSGEGGSEFPSVHRVYVHSTGADGEAAPLAQNSFRRSLIREVYSPSRPGNGQIRVTPRLRAT